MAQSVGLTVCIILSECLLVSEFLVIKVFNVITIVDVCIALSWSDQTKSEAILFRLI
jgi:hypothetical protein